MRPSSILAAAAAFFGALGTLPFASAQVMTGGERRGIQERVMSNMEKVKNGTFDQLLDHSDPSKGTFKQRFWWNDEFYKGPGSPVFLFNSGESNASRFSGFLENVTLPGLYAQEFGGAVIVIERESWEAYL